MSQKFWKPFLAVLIIACCMLITPNTGTNRASAADAPNPADWADFQKQVQPFLSKYCYSCHGDNEPQADVQFNVFKDANTLTKGMPHLEKALELLNARQMPPKNKPRPTDAELAPVVAWLTNYTTRVNCESPRYPGRVTMRRLNRAEYNNTIRDLLAIDFKPADGFPVDDAGYGFDNIGDVLSMAPVLMEKYLTAAGQVLDKAIFAEPALPVPTFRIEAATLEGNIPKSDPQANSGFAQFGRNMLYGRVFGTLGEIHVDYDFPKEGTYIFRVRGYGTQGSAARQRPFVQFRVDGEDVGTAITIKEDLRNTSVYALPGMKFTPGKRRVSLAFTNGATAEELVAEAAAAAAAAATRPATAPADVAAVVEAVAAPAPAANVPAAPAPQPAVDPAVVPAPAAQPPATDPAAAPVAAAPPAVADPVAVPVPAAAVPVPDGVAPAAVALAPATMPAVDPAAAPATQPARGRGARGAGARGGRGGRGAGPVGPAKPTLGVIWIEVEGPIEVTPDRMPESYRRVMIAHPSDTVTKEQAAEKIIRNFASLAYRRPVWDDEVKRLMDLWTKVNADSDSFERSIAHTLEAVLASPYFLYRIEKDPGARDVDGMRDLDDYELATRLSYFLWSSMPDAELFALAEKGLLRPNLGVQIERMIKDPRSFTLVENFAGQWLQLRKMHNVAPDPKLFPDFDEALRVAMIKETQLFFSSIMHDNRSLLDLIDADFTFVNERLAKHYGIPDITGEEFRRVTVSPTLRGGGGLLTHGSILTITSYPNRTSPVQRGQWVLENLLDSPPPPPPPDVPQLKDEKELTGTMRQRMEQHRDNPACSGCHSRMDPIGFGLENFDGIGAWRTQEGNLPIDASGEFTDGKAFKGPAELKQILKTKQDQFCRCITEKLLTYALGRGLESYDRCTVDEIVAAMKKNDYKFSTLVSEIVKSDPFQKRGAKRGEQ